MTALDQAMAGRAPADWRARIRTRTWLISACGYGIIGVFVLAFGAWAATVPIDGATIASGVVAAAGQNIAIQHMEGGIVQAIAVHEGDAVKAGQPLVTLDPTAAEAQLNRQVDQLFALEVRAASLQGERDGRADFVEPTPDHVASNGFDFQELVREQRKEFEARLARYNAEQSILQQRVQALVEAIDGLQAQKAANEDELAIVKDELKRKKALLAQGLTNRSEYTNLLRTEAELVGQLGSIESQIATSRSQRVEALQQIERQKTSRIEDAVTELNKDRTSIRDLEEQVRATRAILDRTVIRSPVDGVVVRSTYNSVGSVIRPGEQILEILPTTEDLIIEARVSPRDIDTVRVGEGARLRFAALNVRRTPEVDGVVTYLSADHQIDQRTGQAYYVARLRIPHKLPPEITRDQVYPGTPVEIFINTGGRTFFEYLFRPVMDSFSRAFRET